jgi:hypothetical protein
MTLHFSDLCGLDLHYATFTKRKPKFISILNKPFIKLSCKIHGELKI